MLLGWLLAFIPTLFLYGQAPTETDIVYATVGDHSLTLDLYLPQHTDTPALIVWVHGGAWHSGSKANPPLGLLDAGFALASVGYRRSVEAVFPAQVFDIKAAIRYLRAHAEKYGYTAENIAIWGASAGGHLAALVGTTNNHAELEGTLGDHRDESSSVQAIIDFFGPTNFLTILEQSTPHGLSVRAPALALLLGKPLDQAVDLAQLASPVFHVDESDPPLFMLHGDQDIQVPINQSHELEGHYVEYGLDVRFDVVHGAGHTNDPYFSPEYIDLIADFLSRVFSD